jgi:hypothetical protein
MSGQAGKEAASVLVGADPADLHAVALDHRGTVPAANGQVGDGPPPGELASERGVVPLGPADRLRIELVVGESDASGAGSIGDRGRLLGLSWRR